MTDTVLEAGYVYELTIETKEAVELPAKQCKVTAIRRRHPVYKIGDILTIGSQHGCVTDVDSNNSVLTKVELGDSCYTSWFSVSSSSVRLATASEVCLYLAHKQARQRKELEECSVDQLLDAVKHKTMK